MVLDETGANLATWCGGFWYEEDSKLSVPTLEGTELISSGQYIVKDLTTGRFRGMGASEFESRYELQGTGDSGEKEYKGIQSEEDLQAVHQRRRI